ncbi:alpha-1,2-fucosyltransferase [Stella sp.]|uniref:alpha-1,2-fucosyltransferase n=1 Tax=Stella sp. TaxID=2912054 RepID=UPI0035B33D89
MIGCNHLGRIGRLGNQMFQYAALRGIAAVHGYEFCIPDSDFRDPFRDHQLFAAFRMAGAVARGRVKGGHYRERTLAFDEGFVRHCPDGVSLFGFFQTERYFAHVADMVAADFAFDAAVLARCRTAVGRLERPIALHVRRTDYLANRSKHHVLKGVYYAAALRRFAPDRPVVVFSDDIAWCRRQPLFAGRRFLFANSGDNVADLCMMSLCDGHVIANSSFSWWGAWLARRPGVEVVAPGRWFARHQSTWQAPDILPARWTAIAEG